MVIANNAIAQPCNYLLSGHVEDVDTNEKLVAATASIKETGKQIVTNEKGDFVFTALCAGEYTLLITHVSCDTVVKKIILTKMMIL